MIYFFSLQQLYKPCAIMDFSHQVVFNDSEMKYFGMNMFEHDLAHDLHPGYKFGTPRAQAAISMMGGGNGKILSGGGIDETTQFNFPTNQRL